MIEKLVDLPFLPRSWQHKIRNLPLSGKINLIISTSTIPLFILLVIGFVFSISQMATQMNASLEESMVAAKNGFAFYRKQTREYARTLASNSVIQKQMLAKTINSGPLKKVSDSLMKSAGLHQVTIHDKNGTVIIRAHRETDFGSDESRLAHIQSVLTQGQPYDQLTLDEKLPVIQSTVPIVYDSEILGSVTAGYYLNHNFADRIYQLTRAHIFFIINDELVASSLGDLIPPPQKAGKNAPPTEHLYTYHERNHDWSKLQTVKIYRAGEQPEEIEYSFRYVDLEAGNNKNGIDSAGIAVVMDQSSARFKLIFFLVLTGILSVLIIFISLLIALKIAFNIKKSIRVIRDGLTQIAGGDMKTNIRVTSKDELGEVASTFNSMVTDLDSSYTSLEDARKKLADYADHLEDKVEERTAELQKTLQEVQTLKTQQDGDYFLTSLLLEPLGSNRTPGVVIQVDFLVQQKKKFLFRKWEKEIGGDICIADTIKLRGGNYTAFLNADAMGKSMQGAGGILVLGAAFQSILERNRMFEQVRTDYPETWLKAAFIEMHRLFESFDGSMLISVAMGLVDNNTGFVYYINAEHPFSVLYRDGTAKFIEDEIWFRKLGTQGCDSDIFISTFQLKPGDMFICGSDGRDDIDLGNDENGMRIIQEDEHRFLEHVEHSNAELALIRESLAKTGDFTDDLSLLRIYYRDNPDNTALNRLKIESNDKISSEIKKLNETRPGKKEYESAVNQLLELYPQNIKLLKTVARFYFKRKDYKQALQAAENLVNIEPQLTDYIYMASYSAKMINKLNKAEKLGERVRLREPRQIKNLLNLTNICMLQKNYQRALKHLARIDRAEPGNKKAASLRLLVQKKMQNRAV